MWLILVEVSVKVACSSKPLYESGGQYICSLSTYFGGSICVNSLSVHDSHRLKALSYLHATYLVEVSVKLLILVEVSVKVACRSTTATDSRHRAITMLLPLVEVSLKVACRSTQLQSAATEPCYLSWWKYL